MIDIDAIRERLQIAEDADPAIDCLVCNDIPDLIRENKRLRKENEALWADIRYHEGDVEENARRQEMDHD